MGLGRREFLVSGSLMAASLAARRAGAAGGAKYKACIIGDSKEGGYGHAIQFAFSLRDDVAVVAVADPDEAGRAKCAAETGAERTYADYAVMLEKEQPDLVAVGPRWSARHKDYLLACAAVGAHGFIEKPLCVDLEEADAMVAAIEAKNLKWAIAFNVRAMPIVQHAQRLIARDGLIGTLLEARARGKEDARAGGEDLIVLGTHVLDLMRFFLDGEPASCCADITAGGRPAVPADVREPSERLGPVVGDRIHAMYGFPHGMAGYFDSMKNLDGNGGRFGIDLYGSRGVVSIRIGAAAAVYWLDEPTWAPGGRESAWRPLPDAPTAALSDPVKERNKAITDDLIAAVEEERTPAISLQDGRAAVEMIQAANEAYITGGRVSMPLTERSHPLRRWR
ncbi:MAG: Gfo/Idh/MocA family oxidoreductase [Candidatus Hydrogenedentes bacterium]|nr:Gfo/Idh/MocA family oxidoreductase [Candidatus Hydrogenedentota bacterium]